MAIESGERIVVGLDHSECSHQALQWAMGEAERTHRPLSLVHVWHWTNDAVTVPSFHNGPAPRHRELGWRLLHQAADGARKRGIEVGTHLIEGSPPEALLDASSGAAMLVVGSHGRGVFTRALMGSVAETCLHRSLCPVVVVPTPVEHSAPGKDGRSRRADRVQSPPEATAK